ncbi:hypothetical protein [Acinetobacter sp. Ac_5812]|uniref:hypothetical protein n=1 Tax=Acinetobacter sp. Ac_5812 TaxID=1848937 RepID=UPI00148F7973|nr:hypothetical protein [Acinetobacter sp. Ac_5812]NNP70391.1 hypothetical protein [Acinetobacter sp. Ac_5812]
MFDLPDQQKTHFQAQVSAVSECQNYFYKSGETAGFDSAAGMPEVLPSALLGILNIVGFDSASDIDNGIKVGIQQYQYCHGGELPHPSVIATALDAGLSMAKKVHGFTGTLKDNLSSLETGFDDVSNTHQESVSIVPAMTVATIATVIAYAAPIIAYIPNNNGSNEVPIVAARFTTDRAFGAMDKGDYLDGVNASKPYSEGRFRFALSNGGNGAVYTVVAHTKYDDFAAKTPDTNTPLLPFIGGNISIRINGKEVAHTRNRSKSKLAGQISAIAEKKAVIAGTVYSVTASTINLDTSAISVTLNQALPAGAKLEVFLIADYDARDNNNKFKLEPVGVSIAPDYETLVSAPIVTQIRGSKLLVNQLTNELNVGFVGTALSLMQGKIYLEQTVRLLSEGKERAIYNEREFTFDASRGVTGNLAAAYNTTGDLFGEFMKYLEAAKTQIVQDTGGATVGFDLYVGDSAKVFFAQLSSDKMPTKTGATAGHGQIVRIGTLADGTNVYHVPSSAEVLVEAGQAFEMLLVGRGSEPVRNPIVGFIEMPLTVSEATPDPRESLLALIGSQAAELNPLDRYADQFSLLKAINMPKLKD